MRPDEIVAREFCRAWCGVAPRTPEQIAVIVDNTWTDFIPEAQSALLALEEAGFVVVPRVPTEAMLDAADEPFHTVAKDQVAFNKRVGRPLHGLASGPFSDAIWSAMLTASQSPPAKETA